MKEWFEEGVTLAPEISMHCAQTTTKISSPAEGSKTEILIIDPIRFGWFKILRILSNVIFCKKIYHKVGHKASVPDCNWCNPTSKQSEPRMFNNMFKSILFQYETRVIWKSEKPSHLEKYEESSNILMFKERISLNNPFRFKDLDSVPFIDAREITGPVTIILIDSPILYFIYYHLYSARPTLTLELT